MCEYESDDNEEERRRTNARMPETFDLLVLNGETEGEREKREKKREREKGERERVSGDGNSSKRHLLSLASKLKNYHKTR